MAIGVTPFGILLTGALSAAIGPSHTLVGLGLAGLALNFGDILARNRVLVARGRRAEDRAASPKQGKIRSADNSPRVPAQRAGIGRQIAQLAWFRDFNQERSGAVPIGDGGGRPTGGSSG